MLIVGVKYEWKLCSGWRKEKYLGYIVVVSFFFFFELISIWRGSCVKDIENGVNGNCVLFKEEKKC